MNNVSLAIFDTFKTRSTDLTAKAMRQRAIISALTGNVNPAEKTRTAITRRITKSKEWKNTYSGVFLDMSEVLIPLDFIQEQGRMPLNRGPKALQEKGVPYYGLTRKGFIVAMALSKTVNVRAVLGACFIGMTEEEKEICLILTRCQQLILMYSLIRELMYQTVNFYVVIFVYFWQVG